MLLTAMENWARLVRLLCATNYRDANGSAAKLPHGRAVGNIEIHMPFSNQRTSVENTVRSVVRFRPCDANHGAKR